MNNDYFRCARCSDSGWKDAGTRRPEGATTDYLYAVPCDCSIGRRLAEQLADNRRSGRAGY